MCGDWLVLSVTGRVLGGKNFGFKKGAGQGESIVSFSRTRELWLQLALSLLTSATRPAAANHFSGPGWQKQKMREIALALHGESRVSHAASVCSAVVKSFDILVKSS